MSKPDSIADYIKAYPAPVQHALKQVYDTIKKAAPKAEESISYGIPTFKVGERPLIYFAAAKKHIGLHALPSGHEAFEEEFSRYKRGKGSVQFPLDEAMPLALIAKVTRYRLKEVNEQTPKPAKAKK